MRSVNYHRLAAPNGEGRRTLEKLIYSYLGDWIDRQRADQKAGRRRRRCAPRPCRAPESRTHQDSGGRTALRHLRALEAAARTADRLGAGHQRRRADKHPPLHDRTAARTRAAQTRASCARRRRSSGTRIAARSRPATRPTIPGSGAGMRRRPTSPAARTSMAIAGTISTTAAPRSSPLVIATARRWEARLDRLCSQDAHRRAAGVLHRRFALAGWHRRTSRASLDGRRRAVAAARSDADESCSRALRARSLRA